MNKIYRLKFDRRRNQLVAVSELTTGAGKQKSTGRAASRAGIAGTGVWAMRPMLAALAFAALPGLALANPDLPVGGQVIAGQGAISTSGNQMTIRQQTDKLVTQWQSFDIGAQNTVRFIQPDSNAVALNRVTGASGSQILGSLQANGQVIILNPNGVMFGKNAQVNVAGLLASTKSLGNADFMAGRYDLSGGGADAQVVNQGSLVATPGGYIVLAGGQVKNSGTISTPAGKAVLATADKVSLKLDNAGLVSVSVSGSIVNALVENTGLIAAPNGQVYLTARGRDMLLNTVVNNSGTVEATGLESRGGEIVLDGGDSGVVSQSGRLLADSATGQGGKVTIEGRNIHLTAAGKTSATGKTGGGQVYVGGGWQGKDGKIRNASKVVMDKAATVDVSATQGGNGGTAVLWSEDYTNFQGAITARGGADSGNGGQVETSSRGNLQAFGDVDASASAGLGGGWLLDPLNIAIVKGDVDTDTALMQGDAASGQVFSPSVAGAQVSATKIAEQLSAGTSVTVDTHANGDQPGTITFKKDAQIKKAAGGAATLTLRADKDIVFENRDWVAPSAVGELAAILSTAGALNLDLLTGNSGQDGNVNIGKFVHLDLNGGDFHAGPAKADSGKASLKFTNNGTITAGNITLDTLGGTSGNYYGLTASGDLTVKGPLALTAGFGIVSNVKAGGMLSITADAGDIRFSADSGAGSPSAGGTIAISGKNGVVIQANNGQLVMSLVEGGKKKPNVIRVESTDGDVALAGKRKGALGSSDGLQLTKASVSSDSGVMTLTGDGVKLSGNTLSAARLEVTGLVAKGEEPLAGNTLQGGLGESSNVVLGPTKDPEANKDPVANSSTNPDTPSQPQPDTSEETKPKPEVTPEPKPEEKPDPKPEVTPEPKPEEKPEPKPEEKPDPKPEEKPDPKPEVTPEPKPEVTPEPKPEEKPEPKPEEKPDPKPEVTPDPKPEVTPDPKPEVTPDPKPEVTPDPKPEVAPKPEVTPEPKPEVTPDPKPEVQPKPEDQIGELPGPFPQLTAGEVAAVKSAVVTAKSQSSVNAQTSAQAQAPQSGFHVKGEPAVPASHYEMATQEVSVNVCAGEECGSLTLDASKPSE
ncbi:filamentous hemagglutinin N-terminal domain-containing protein [Achromobacter xylosoxidans]